MNQGISFARTIRALDAGDFRASKLGLFLAAAVLAAWVWWAVAARVPQYESSTSAYLDSTGENAVAYFPASENEPILAGQSAVFRRGGNSIGALVTAAAEANGGQVRVNLRLSRPALHPAGPVSVELERGRVSPAVIALEAAGLRTR